MLYGKGYVAKYGEHNTTTYLVLLYTTFVPEVDIVVYSTLMGNKVCSINVFFVQWRSVNVSRYIMPRGNTRRMTNMEDTESRGISQCM
jgi:hypothetical protein